MTDGPAGLYGPRYWPTWVGVAPWWGASMLPLPMIRQLGAAIGAIAYRTVGERRRIAERNLEICFPEWDSGARARVLKNHFRAAGQSILDLGVGVWASSARLNRLMRVVGYEHLAAARENDRAVLLLAPHFVGLPMGALYLSTRGPIAAMYKRPRNRLVHEGYVRVCTGYESPCRLLNRVVSQRSESHGIVLVEHRQGMRGVVRALRAGQPFYYLPDQDLGRRHAVFAPFFGVPAVTVTAASRFARMTDAQVMLCHTRQLPRGEGYELSVEAPLEGFTAEDGLKDATVVNREIERIVRQVPEQYFWLHRRFKTRPPGEPDLYD